MQTTVSTTLKLVGESVAQLTMPSQAHSSEVTTEWVTDTHY